MEFGNLIAGSEVRNGVITDLRRKHGEQIDEKKLKVEILRFEKPDYHGVLSPDQIREFAAYDSAGDSLRVKVAAFRKLGVEVTDRDILPQEIPEEEFQKMIDGFNADSSITSIIIQNPVPEELQAIVKRIAPEKDLDALSGRPGRFITPATSEGIFRVMEPFARGKNIGSAGVIPQAEAAVRMIEGFAQDDVAVAVVGAEGFVGRGVVGRLKELKIRYIAIDQRYPDYSENSLMQVRDADIVISTVGQPGILDERHLTPYHRLVVDCGYVPQENGEKLGDVARSAYRIPQNITPVPNGTGPIEMAVLMERIVEQYINPNLERWKLENFYPIAFLSRQEIAQLQRQWAAEIGAIAKDYFDQVISPADRTSVVQNHLVLDTIDGLNSGDRQPWQEIEKHIEQVVRERPQDRSPPSRGIGR
jgi:5,10-methylene-tetrahydrofolate dehydrogenase/methenyl tetrahydrofolate cyclohydrolase